MRIRQFEERRRTPRTVMSRPISVACATGTHCGYTYDLSETGAGLWLSGAPRLGGWLRLSVELDEGPLMVYAVTRRVVAGEGVDADVGYDVGVEFADVPARSRMRLRESLRGSMTGRGAHCIMYETPIISTLL